MSNSPAAIELTVFTKDGGPLTKRISLSPDGKVISDGSACTMARGQARRARIAGVNELAALIESLESNQAIGLGALRPELPNEVAIVTKAKLKGDGAIARTAENLRFEQGSPAYLLLDHDAKGMPASVADKLESAGGFWEALVELFPALANSSRLLRRSTSAGLRRKDTGEEFAGSGGLHVYLQVKDGSDVRRFLESLHDRCWLAGLGWIALSKIGSHRDMSIVDVSVGSPERLVFEGAPILEPPLEQDRERRRPITTQGETLDTLTACPPLTTTETAEVKRLKDNAKKALAAERAELIGKRTRAMAQERGISLEDARRIIENQCNGILFSSHPLEFDSVELAGKTVKDVLDDPAAFKNQTLADPLDGAEEGRCKAKVMIGRDGVPFINSFARGGVRYQLRYEKSDPEIERLARLSPLEYDQQRKKAAEARGIRVSVLDQAVAAARKRNESEGGAQEERERAESSDPTEFAKINAEFALVLSGDKASIMKFEGGTKFRLLQVGAFKQWFSNQLITVGKNVVTVAENWLNHPSRKQYEGIEFEPGGGRDGYYNLWQGFACEPKEGDCSKFLAHIRDNAARGDDYTFKWMVGWWAQIVQQPTIKMETAFVIRGELGTGKTKIGQLMGSVFGDHYLAIASPRYITGQFNSHMASLLVLHADEAFWAGDKKSEGVLKDLVSGTHHMLEYKRIDAIRIRNFVRLFVCGNPKWLIPAGFKERRWAVFDMGEDHIQDHAYFAAIDDEMNDGGRAALLHHLLNFDLSTVNLRSIPKTAALLEQQIESMDPEQAWWFDTLMHGTLPAELLGGNKLEKWTCPKQAIHKRYVHHAHLTGINHKSTETKLAIFLGSQLGTKLKATRPLINRQQISCWVFPPLADCRNLFAEKIGQAVDWGVQEGEVQEWQHKADEWDRDWF